MLLIPSSTVDVQNISSIAEEDPRVSLGWSGLIGLAPPIYSAALGDDTKPALSVMNSIFTLNQTQENYITVLLPRHNDPGSTTIGSMTVAEILPGSYSSITEQSKLLVSKVPQEFLDQGAPQLWLTLTDVDGVIGPDGPISYQSEAEVFGPPTGPLSVAFDTGFTLSQVPANISQAIYEKVPGASFNESLQGGAWQVPCDQAVDVSFSFGGQKIPIHPLDVTQTGDGVIDIAEGMCIGSVSELLQAMHILACA